MSERGIGSNMSIKDNSATAGEAKLSLRRLAPLVAIALVARVVIAMGWQRQLSLETLVRHHEAPREFIAAHPLPPVAAHFTLYIVILAPVVPGRVYLPLI